MVTHLIYTDETKKPMRQLQRSLNPLMYEVGKKKVIKLMDNGLIYPISYSRRVSLVQWCVSKKDSLSIV